MPYGAMHPRHDDCLELPHRLLEPGWLVPCTLGMECGAIVPCNILNVHLELVPSGCAAESCGHWISLKEGLDLSCHEGFEVRMGNNGRKH